MTFDKVEELVGSTCANVANNQNREIIFTLENGQEYKLYHSQVCCESVTVEDISGELSDLVGEPLLKVEEVVGGDRPKKDEYDDSFTWTFYHFATIKGYVTIRWYGSSNGYYSESVDFTKV